VSSGNRMDRWFGLPFWLTIDVTLREPCSGTTSACYVFEELSSYNNEEIMTKRMILMLVVAALLIGALGYFKLHQVQDATNAGAFQPPPEAVTTLVAKEETWPSTLSVVGTTVAVHGVT